jgi:hypothetical protein
MYIESEAGGLTGPARTGRATFSRSGATLYDTGKPYRSLKGSGFKANHVEVESAMPISRRHVLVSAGGSLLGCATTPADFRDGGPVPPDRALVLLHLRYTFGRLVIDDPEIGLTRLVAGKSPEDLVLSRVPNKQVVILEVPPGHYFLRRLRVVRGYFRHSFEPRLTLFAARAGPINYPGDWMVDVRVLSRSASGTVARGSSSAEYEIRLATVENNEVPSLLAAKYPILNAQRPLKITKLVEN